MRNVPTIAAIILGAGLALAACSKGGEPAATPTPAPAPTPTPAPAVAEAPPPADGLGAAGGTGEGTITTGRTDTLGRGSAPPTAVAGPRGASVMGTPDGLASITGSAELTTGLDDADIAAGFDDQPITGFGHIGRRPTGTPGTPPTTRIADPSVKGDLDKAIIRRYIKREIRKISRCYEKELASDPKLAGVVRATFTIGADGKVTASAAEGVAPAVASCVAGVIQTIEFPKPRGGGLVHVTYPFTFRIG